MINLNKDIQSLSTFKRNTKEMIQSKKISDNSLVLIVKDKAEIVSQYAAAYQKLLDKIDQIETLGDRQNQSANNSLSSNLLDLYCAIEVRALLCYRRLSFNLFLGQLFPNICLQDVF